MIAAVDTLVVLHKFRIVWLKKFANIFCAVANEPQKGVVGGKEAGYWVCFKVKCVKAKITFFTKLAISNASCCGEAIKSFVQTTVRKFVSFAFFLDKY